MDTPPKKTGRPKGSGSLYTPELAAHICEQLAAGRSLLDICEHDAGMPSEMSIRRWARDDVGGFASEYARARDLGLDHMADELLKIAHTPRMGVKRVEKLLGTEVTHGDMIEHRRLEFDAMRWYLSKLAPKRYGDRIEVAHDLSDELAKRLARANDT